MYDAQLGRFHTQDAYAEKYLDFSPYQYAANNPINFIDVNGDSIWFTYQYNDDKQLTGVTMHVSGKIMNMSNNNVDMEQALADITSSLESVYQGGIDGVEFNTVTDFSVANSMDDVAESDHLIVLSEMSNNGMKGPDGLPVSVGGASNQLGGKVAFVDADYFTGPWDKNIGNTGERLASHEMGHLFNLKHHSDPFNIMKQGGGNKWFSMSTNVTSSQLKSIPWSGHYGNLNKGNNYVYTPVVTSKGIRMIKSPNQGMAAPFVRLKRR